MKKIFLFFYFLFFIFCSEAQNLVPNGDFEYYSLCPNNISQINRAVPWYDPTGATSDYFNACAPISSFISVPNQTIGIWQYARSGVGYSGLWATQDNNSNYREYIQIQLSSPLIASNCYSVTFYCNLYNLLKKGCNNVGAYLSTIAISTTSPNVLNYNPQILMPGNPSITDTVNWIKISGIYMAIGGEEYLTIGNFQNDSNTTFQIADTANPFNGCYYYIDDVSVINCNDTLSSVNEINQQYDVKLYPNPNNGSFTIECSSFENEPSVLNIYDVTGKLIRKQAIIKKDKRMEINANDLDGGIYFYQLVVNEKPIKSDRFIIIK
jgi:hypothetical protein